MKAIFLGTCSFVMLLYSEYSFTMHVGESQYQLRQSLQSRHHVTFALQEERNQSQSAQFQQNNSANVGNYSFLNLSQISNEELSQYESFHNIRNLEMNTEFLGRRETKSILKLSALPLQQLLSLKITGNIGENKTIQKNLDNLLTNTLNIKELFLSGNNLKTLPTAIRKLKQLEILDLSKNPQLKNLPSSLWKSPDLQTVTISSELISSNQVPEYVELFQNEKIVTFLNSYKNQHELSNAQIEITKNNLCSCKIITVNGCHWNDETHTWVKTSSKTSSKIVRLKNMSIANALIEYIKGKEHWNAVAKLVTHGVNINVADANSLDRYGIPILVKASESGHLDVVQYLIKHGADVNVRTKFENTALMGASLFGYLDVAKYLIDQGAEVNDQNAGGETALMRAAGQRHLGIVKYLLQNGADINMQDRFGGTALMKGAYYGSLKIVKYLTKHGADINARDDSGNTVLMRAVLEGQLNIIQYLIDSGANINDQNKYGETALMKAVKEEQIKVVKHLLENNADVNLTDNSGKKAIYWAQELLERTQDENKPKLLKIIKSLE